MPAKKEEIIRAFKNESNICLDCQLTDYHCLPGRLRSTVRFYWGGYCVTVPMYKGNCNQPTICLRIWHDEHDQLKKMQNRVEKVSEAIQKSKLDYFVKVYEYYEKAIVVNGEALPGIKMSWIDDSVVSLGKFLSEKHPTSAQLRTLSSNFLTMCTEMKLAGFAHGDLSSSNILVQPDLKLKLIDYDSMFVPKMNEDYIQEIAGTEGFQSPKRFEEGVTANEKNDYFSQQVIYVQLLAFAKQPSLCNQIDDKTLLFKGNDLTSSKMFRSSPYYKTLFALGDNDIEFYLDEVAKAIDQPLDEVKSLCELTPPSKNRQSESPKPVDDKYRRERVDTLNTQQRVSKEPKKVDGKYRYEIPKSLHIPVGKKGERCVFCNFIISNGYPQANNCPNCGAPRVTYKIAEKI